MANRSAHLVAVALVASALVATGCASEDLDARADLVPGQPLPACPVATRGGGCRAVGPQELVPLASSEPLWPGPVFASGTDAFRTFAVRPSRNRILSLDIGSGWGPRRELPWAEASWVAGAIVQGVPTLYVVTAAPPELELVRLSGEKVATTIPVELEGIPRGAAGAPHVAPLPDGRVLLALCTAGTRLFVGVDEGTGTHFRMSEVPVPGESPHGVMAQVAVTRGGAWVLTYQVTDPTWRSQSWVLVSRNEGASWIGPSLLSEEDAAHPAVLARLDEGADVYWSVPTPFTRDRLVVIHEHDTVSTIRRRPVLDDGTLGPEQLVTSAEVGPLMLSRPVRLANGRPALVAARGDKLHPAHGIAFARLDGDAAQAR